MKENRVWNRDLFSNLHDGVVTTTSTSFVWQHMWFFPYLARRPAGPPCSKSTSRTQQQQLTHERLYLLQAKITFLNSVAICSLSISAPRTVTFPTAWSKATETSPLPVAASLPPWDIVSISLLCLWALWKCSFLLRITSDGQHTPGALRAAGIPLPQASQAGQGVTNWLCASIRKDGCMEESLRRGKPTSRELLQSFLLNKEYLEYLVYKEGIITFLSPVTSPHSST